MASRISQFRYPDRAMKQSKISAMNTLLYFIRKEADVLPKKYEKSLVVWEDTVRKRAELSKEKDPDRFVPVCDVEKYLRKNFLSVVFNTTALYGNTESKRVYSWKEGSIGPLNILLNIAGAHLRFLAMTRYPFPLPRTKRVRRTNKEGTHYFQNDYVYCGTINRPSVIITHPMLPSLDFVDVIRGHLVELCRQCFIHSVPISIASRYINLLTFRLKPLIDKFYLAGFDKKKRTLEFTKKSLSILESVLKSVKGQHGITSGYPLRMTEVLDETGPLSFGLSELIEKIDDSGIRTIITKRQDKHLVDEDDVTQFTSKINTARSRLGTRIHKRLAWGITQPFSAKSVMLGGDYLAKDKTGYILAAEMPVNAGRGKVDYTLLIRKIPESMEALSDSTSGIWPPRLVLDLKTKSAFNWGVSAKTHNSDKSFVVDFPFKRRPLTDSEWDFLIKNSPTPKEQKQVESYAEVLLQEYKTIAKDDLSPPSTILKGIILVDGHERSSRLRRILPKFIKTVYKQVYQDLVEMRSKKPEGELKYPRTLFEPTFRWALNIRIAIVLSPFTLPKDASLQEILPSPIPPHAVSELNPFKCSRDELRHFILYLSADGLSSPGDSAGWIAQQWHGLKFGYDLACERNLRKVVWIDLAGEFTDEIIRAVTLRLDFHHDRVVQFCKDIEFLDLSVEIENALFSGDELPSAESIKSRIRNYDFVIVSGIDTIRQITPKEFEGLVDTLSVHIANATSLPETCTLWFGTPQPLATTSELYKRSQLRPFRHDSPLQPYINEIVMNIPLPPRKGGSKVPIHDHVRGLVSIGPDMKKRIRCTTIGIPPLIGWSKRFLSRKPSDKEQKLMDRIHTRPPSTFRWLESQGTSMFSKDMAIELFPFLESWDPRSNESSVSEDKNLDSLEVKKKKLGGKKGYKGSSSRLTFSANLCIPSPRSINTKREYEQTELVLKPLKSTPHPPNHSELVHTEFSSNEATRIELVRLQDTCKFLLSLNSSSSYLKEHCKEVIKVIAKAVKLPSADMVQKFAGFFRNSRYSSQTWYRLLWVRDWLDGWPMPSSLKKELAELRVERKDILHYYGNYLILMIASLTEHYAIHQTEIQFLWKMVMPWITLQMGARSRTGLQPDSEYDTASIYEQLKAKIIYWNRVPYPRTTTLSNIRYGLRVDVSKSNPGKYRWYVFEDGSYSNRFIAGCVEQDVIRPGLLPLIRANAVTSLDDIAILTDFKFKNCIIRPFLIAEHQGINILYETEKALQNMSELNGITNPSSFNWDPVGMIRFGTRSRNAPARLRYIKVLTLGMKYPSIRNQLLPERQADFGEKLFEHIETIGVQTSGVTRVKCSLEGTIDCGSISFKMRGEKRWKKVGQNIAHKDKNQAVQTLLLPYNAGIAVQGRYSWDPLTDFHFRFGGEELRKEVVSRIQLDKEEGV